MPGVYGGDDVSAIVLDVGSSLLRGGWAGEDTPRIVIPSSFGWVSEDQGDGGTSDDNTSATVAVDRINPQATRVGADGDTSMADVEAEASNGNGETNGKESSSASITAATSGPVSEATDSRSRIAKYTSKKALDGKSAKKRKYYFGDAGVNQWRSGMEISPTVLDGNVQSPVDLFHMLNYALDSISADSTEHPLLLTEAAWTPRETREELTEMAFEGLGVPAYYLANSTVLSSFSAGKPSSLILDVGYSSISATPVVDGFVIRKGMNRQVNLGGAAVSRGLAYDLKNPPARTPRVGGPIADLVPTYRVKSKKPVEAGREAQWEERATGQTTDSFRQYQEERLLHEAKESLSQCLEQGWDEGQALSRPSRPYEFPNGYNDLFGVERFRASEVMFTPSLWDGIEGVLPPPSTAANVTSVQQLVANAIGSVDVDSRPTLLSNIVCVGGGAFVPGFVDRLSYELSNQAPGQRIKIHSPGNSIERRHASWLGGSILASLGSFHQMWISKEEYEEHGPSIVHARAR